jgi:Fe-S cluster assembly iron-binding protein IscA
MLVLTQEAVEVINGIVEDDESGLRIATGEASGDEIELELAVAPSPEAGDETVEQDGVRVYLTPEASELLSDKLLDAHAHDDHVHFTIAEQEGA